MKAVFLDRDGTVIFDPEDERVDTVEKIRLFPDSLEALRGVRREGRALPTLHLVRNKLQAARHARKHTRRAGQSGV